MLQSDSPLGLCVSCAADRCTTCPANKVVIWTFRVAEALAAELAKPRLFAPPQPMPTARPLPDHVFKARGVQIGLRTCLDRN